MELFARWQLRAAGLFTFPQSAMHAALYQKFGFWPRFLTAIMARPATSTVADLGRNFYSKLSIEEQNAALRECRELTEQLYPGLDLTGEIRDVQTAKLGDTALVWEDSKLVAFAVCHCGAGTEAGVDNCYVKFGGVRPDARALRNFGRLLDACEALAIEKRLPRVLAGINLASNDGYREMLRRGFRTQIQGVAMHRDNDPAFCRPEFLALGDWR